MADQKSSLQLISDRLHLIAHVSSSVLGSAPTTERLPALLDQVRCAFQADACVLRVLDGKELVLLASSGIPEGTLAERLPLEWGIPRVILQEWRPVTITDVREHPVTSPLANPASPFPFLSYAGSPLLADERFLGILGLYCTEAVREFSREDLDHLQIVANQIAVAIENERLFRETEAQQKQLAHEVEVRRRAEETLTFVLANAGCLLWYADVTENSEAPSGYRWKTWIFDEVAAQAFLCLEIRPPETFVQAWIRSCHEDDLPALAEMNRRALSTGMSRYSQEFRYRRGNKEVRWLREDIYLEPAGAGRFRLAGICTDVTERRALEDQLRQSQKMEAVGRLAGGIAHDFNNMLAVINGYSALLLPSLQPGDPVHAGLAEIQKAGERAAGLTRQLLAYSRRQVLAVTNVDLHAVIADLTSILCRLIGEEIELTVRLEAVSGLVRADRNQLQQVLLNFAVNARDAMPEGGRLSLVTRGFVLKPEDRALYPELMPGPYLELEVTDNGCGIPEEALPRVFEPFFTTKPAGEGTGLGLATVYGIVKQCGGHAEVGSELGRGTVFRVLLPAVPHDLPTQPPGT